MIFLNDNVLLEKKITSDMIKPRLLGHWGTCPGLVLVYAHLNRIIKKTGLDALYVVGPGNYYYLYLETRAHCCVRSWCTCYPVLSLDGGLHEHLYARLLSEL